MNPSKKITSIITENKTFFIQIIGDEDNWYEFKPTGFCKKPFVGYPVKIENEFAIPNQGWDAEIDGKYHLITIKKVIDENHIDVESMTTVDKFRISIKQFI